MKPEYNFGVIEDGLARLVRLEEGRITPPNYSNELTEIRKLLAKPNLVYGEVLNATSGTILMHDKNTVNFETDQPLGTTPTLNINLTPSHIQDFKLQHIRYLFNSANDVSFELYLFESNIGSTYNQKARCIFDSGASKVKNTMYLDEGANMLPVNVHLRDAGKLYYMIDWSAAPGSTAGYIVIMGEEIK